MERLTYPSSLCDPCRGRWAQRLARSRARGEGACLPAVERDAPGGAHHAREEHIVQETLPPADPFMSQSRASPPAVRATPGWGALAVLAPQVALGTYLAVQGAIIVFAVALFRFARPAA